MASASGVWGILVTWRVSGSFDFSGYARFIPVCTNKAPSNCCAWRHMNDNDYQPLMPHVSASHMHHLFFHLSSDGSLIESKLFTLQHVTINTSTLARSA